MQNYLVRNLLFYMFPDSSAVTNATGWIKEHRLDLTFQPSPTAREVAMSSSSPRQSSLVDVIHSTVEVLGDLTDVTLQTKLDEIELNPESSYDRNMGHLPVEIDDSDLLPYAKLTIWTVDQAICLSLGLKPVPSTIDRLKAAQDVNIRQLSFFQEFHQRSEMLAQAFDTGRLARDVGPLDITRFLVRMDVKIPTTLLGRVERFVELKSNHEGQVAGAVMPDDLAPSEPNIGTKTIFDLVIDKKRKILWINDEIKIKGSGFDLLHALSAEFIKSAGQGLSLLDYTTINAGELASRAGLSSDASIRQRVYRTRAQLSTKFSLAGLDPDDGKALIETIPWNGYRLCAGRVRVSYWAGG